MPKELHKLKVNEISMVDVPANAHAKVRMFKRHDDAEPEAISKTDAEAVWNTAVADLRKRGASLHQAHQVLLDSAGGRALYDIMSVDLDAARAHQRGIAKSGSTPAADRANRLAAEHHQEQVRQGRKSTHAKAYAHVMDSHDQLRAQVLEEERNG